MNRAAGACLAVSAVAIATAPPAPAAEVTVLATAAKVEGARAWGGTAVFSQYDAPAKAYRLVVVRPGAAPAVLPTSPRRVPFDADVGPGPDGRPTAVFSRCRAEKVTYHGTSRGCAVRQVDLTTGRERRIRSTDVPGVSEVHPTVWRDRVAWVSVPDRGRARPEVRSRDLRWPASRPSQRLAGIPPCTRTAPAATCEPTTGLITELDLRQRTLAENLTLFTQGDGGGCARRIQLVTPGGPARTAVRGTCGEADKTYVGVGFARDALHWATVCRGDASGCDGLVGAWRFDLRTGRATRATFPPLQLGLGAGDLTGFAATGPESALVTRTIELTSTCAPTCGALLRVTGLRHAA